MAGKAEKSLRRDMAGKAQAGLLYEIGNGRKYPRRYVS